MKSDKPEFEVRYEDGEIDEVVTNAKQHVHIERMSDGHIWMSMGCCTFNFYVNKGKLMFQEQYE